MGLYNFTRSDVRLAEKLFADAIKKYYGEIWNIKSDGEYKGCSWETRSMLPIDSGIWRLCHIAKHRGATRAAGRIELTDSGTLLKFILFYNPVNPENEKRIIV